MTDIPRILSAPGLTPRPLVHRPLPSGVTATLPAKSSATDGVAAFTLTAPAGVDAARVRLVSINDLHGQLADSSSKVGDIPIGGAATLSSYIDRERAGNPGGTLLISAGDMIGAAPPSSTLMRHESTIAVLAAMGMDVSTLGNHEFDAGYKEMVRLLAGDDAVNMLGTKRKRKKTGAAGRGDAAAGAKQLKPAWPGSPFPWVTANLIDTRTGKRIAKPYVIREVNGVKVAIVGVMTGELKEATDPNAVKHLRVIDPARSVNALVPELKKQGVRTIIVALHEGGTPDPKDSSMISGPVIDIAKRLHPEVDVIASAHTHQEYVHRVNGKLITQASSYGKALASIDLLVDRATGDVVASDARIVHNDERGIAPDPQVASMVNRFEKAVKTKTDKPVGTIPAPLTREATPAGESALGNVIADAQRAAAKADVAIMNPGGIRQDLSTAGPITWGDLFSVQPFANRVTRIELTGAEMLAVLEQMFVSDTKATILQVSGMTVTFDASKPIGKRIVSVTMADGKQLDPKRTYTMALNSFLADGGDGFTTLKKGRQRTEFGIDLDVLVKHMAKGDLPTKPEGRLVLAGGKLPPPK